jgi:hypothetical protein
MIKYLLSILFLIFCLGFQGQIKVEPVNLKAKQNKELITNQSLGNGVHERNVLGETTLVGGKPDSFTQSFYSEEKKVVRRRELEDQLNQIKNKKREIRSDRSFFKTSKANGTWQKLLSSEKRLKLELKETKK